MRKIWSTQEEVLIEERAKPYFEKKAGVFPEMLRIVLRDEDMAAIRKKIANNTMLNAGEQENLVKKYVEEQRRYKNNCIMISDWAQLNGDLLFFDSIGTDITKNIYQITEEDILTANKTFATLPENEAKNTKEQLALGILNMTPQELAEYKEKQKSVFFSLGE